MAERHVSGRTVAWVVGLALLLWWNAFGFGWLPFWWAMLLAAIGVSLLAVLVQGIPPAWRRWTPSDLLLGVLSGLGLYVVFWVGDWLTGIVLPNQAADLGGLYEMLAGSSLGASASLVLLAVLAEEFFWRGFVQHQLALRQPQPWPIILATLGYTVAHMGTGSPLLFLATTTAGLAWGVMYAWRGALLPVLVSHLVFDALAIFVAPFSV